MNKFITIDNQPPLPGIPLARALAWFALGLDGWVDFGCANITLARGPRLNLICFSNLHRLLSTVLDYMLLVGEMSTQYLWDKGTIRIGCQCYNYQPRYKAFSLLVYFQDLWDIATRILRLPVSHYHQKISSSNGVRTRDLWVS
jgi:hypothetical protein